MLMKNVNILTLVIYLNKRKIFLNFYKCLKNLKTEKSKENLKLFVNVFKIDQRLVSSIKK